MEPALKLEYYEVESVEEIRPTSKKRRKKRVPIPVLICLTAMLFVGGGLFYINQQVITMQMNVKIGQLGTQLADLKQENDHLLLTLKETTRLSTIEIMARQELGMIDPVGTEMLVMNQQPHSESEAAGWIDAPASETQNLFTVVANWMNRLLPVGGVEAGRIGQ